MVFRDGAVQRKESVTKEDEGGTEELKQNNKMTNPWQHDQANAAPKSHRVY